MGKLNECRLPAVVLFLSLFVCLLSPRVVRGQQLFEGTPRESHVRQGSIGTCYFHAVISGMANVNPSKIKGMIKEGGSIPGVSDTVYEVSLAGGAEEFPLKADVVESREGGYDKSTGGLWVAVLMRSFALSVLRAKLVDWFQRKAPLPPFAGPLVVQLLSEDKVVIQAYDAAVRTAIDPSGNVDRATFAGNLKKRLQKLNLPPGVGDILVQLASSVGLLAAVEEVAKENGEVFGANRAIGNGGIPSRAAGTLFGMRCSMVQMRSTNAGSVFAKMKGTLSDGGLVVAATGGACSGSRSSWFVTNHAFAILGVSGNAASVRNPWESTPTPFSVPSAEFMSCFEWVEVCK